MKSHIKTLAIFFCFIFISCEDVVDIDVPTGKIRLVIEASLNWEKGTLGNQQFIKLSTSTPYFETNVNPIVTGASVKVVNIDTSEEFIFNDENDGTYTISNFTPIIGDNYNLEIVYNNETYSASETLMPVSEINRITQSREGGFDDELLEVNYYFDDPANEENYYLTRFYEEGDLFPVLADISDEFVNGNEIHDFWEKEDDEDNGSFPFEVGDIVNINLYGISEQYYNYIRLLIEQYNAGGGPFSSLAAQVRGNCVNITNSDNYAYGYFRLTEVSKASYTIQ